MKKIALFLLLLLTASFNNLIAQNKTGDVAGSSSDVRVYRTQRLAGEKPVVDGNLNDACWLDGEWAGDFIQWIPREGAKPTYPTFLKILYDDQNIYVAIRAMDSEPEKISKRAGRRDEMAGDMVGINFDSYHDHRTGFEFNLTAAGQKIDAILTNPMVADFDWNAVWTGKVGMEDSAWVAEYEIPLSQLRYSSSEVQTWGLHCWRWIDRLQEESDWEPQSSTGPGLLYQFGHLEGIEGLPKSRRIELMPYSVGKLKSFEKVAANPYARDGRKWGGSVGLDAKIGISSNFTADIAINPDFGQVESDPSVMNLTAYETFYEEKRPFFLEGVNIFDYEFNNTNLFYSRRIGSAPTWFPDLGENEYIDYPENSSILSAVKVSGKSAKGLSVGILQSLTQKEMASITSDGEESKTAVEPMTSYTVARLQQDFNDGTTVLGGIFTSTNRFLNDEKFNYLNRNAFTGGLDLLHQWNDKEFYLKARLIGSSVNGDKEAIAILQRSSARYFQRPGSHLSFDVNRTILSGQGGEVAVGKGSKGFWRYSATLNWQSPGLELNDMGYMQQADWIRQRNQLSYFVNQPVGIFRRYNLDFDQKNNWDFGGNYLYSDYEIEGDLEFLNKWALSPSFTYIGSTFDTRLLRGGPAMKLPSGTEIEVALRTDFSKRLSFDFEYGNEARSGKTANYATYALSATYRPVNRIKLAVSAAYAHNFDELQYVGTVSAAGDPRYILGHLDQETLNFTFRVDYIITPELSLQYYGSPFASAGKFSKFKHVDNPMADRLTERFELLNPAFGNNEYTVSEPSGNNYSFRNPDFDFGQFRSNLVFRWEYRPGSQLYFVWSNEQTSFRNETGGSLGDAFTSMRKMTPQNLFLIKLSYWFTI